MDRRFLEHYNRELQHLREVGAEFAREFPKIASRLGMEDLEVADPYVERLLEGFSFLTARVQLKLDAEFPRFTQHLLESVYPGYITPVPSMLIARFEPEPAEGSLMEGVPIPRGSVLKSVIAKGEQTACEYRTAHDVTLWPIEIAEVQYLRLSGSAAGAGLPPLPEIRAGKVKAAIRIRLRTTTGVAFDRLPIEAIALHLTGAEDRPLRLHEQLVANATGLVVRPAGSTSSHTLLGREAIRAMGFDDDEALLPPSRRRFSGYRLLQEYFAFPNRFLFVELRHLGPAIRECPGPELDVLVLLDRVDAALESSLDASALALFCSPAINLFPRRADRIHLAPREYEYAVVPDRTRGLDYEVYEVLEVAGFTEGGQRARTFEPFYASRDLRAEAGGAFFTLRRMPRLLSDREDRRGPRTGYLGSEAYLSIVDAREAPFRSDLRQLSVETLCTNRDLPLLLPAGAGKTDFSLLTGAPVRSVRVIAGPTRPRPPMAESEAAWRLIGHLTLNYLSLADSDPRQGATALRDMLALYGDLAEPAVRKQIDGVRSIQSTPVLRRLTQAAATSWVRGLQLELTFDDAAFQGSGAFVLGTVLERFFSRYVTLNSFTETIVRTLDRGEIARWPARLGDRALV